MIGLPETTDGVSFDSLESRSPGRFKSGAMGGSEILVTFPVNWRWRTFLLCTGIPTLASQIPVWLPG